MPGDLNYTTVAIRATSKVCSFYSKNKQVDFQVTSLTIMTQTNLEKG